VVTRIIKVSPRNPDPKTIALAANVLKKGGLVCFPTETVYGLGAFAFNGSAIRKVFKAKGRPSDNPLIVHIADIHDLNMFAVDIPRKAVTLARRFWPGPLTLVLPSKKNVPDIVRGGLSTVAVRVPDHPVALALIRRLGTGIVAPSANLSGRPSPTKANHVFADLKGKVDLILDAGATKIGIESTVLDLTVHPPAILRQGGLAKEKIGRVIGLVQDTKAKGLLKRSPGTRYRHYAPRATLMIVRNPKEVRSVLRKGKRVGLIYHSFDPRKIRTPNTRRLRGDASEFAKNLFATIRELDDFGLDIILVERVRKRGIGNAIMERLQKAAEE